MHSAASAPSQAAYSKPGFGNARPAARWSGLTQNRRGRVSPPTVAYDRLWAMNRRLRYGRTTGSSWATQPDRRIPGFGDLGAQNGHSVDAPDVSLRMWYHTGLRPALDCSRRANLFTNSA